MSESTVYVTNIRGHDFSHARTFGRIHPIWDGPLVDGFKLDQLLLTTHAALRDSRPEDWLVTTGHMILGIVAAAEFLRRHRRLNLLIFHIKKKIYIPRHFKLDLAADLSDPALQEMILEAGHG